MPRFRQLLLRATTCAVCVAVMGCDPKEPGKPDSGSAPVNARIQSGAVAYSALSVAGGVFDFDDALVQKILDTAAVLQPHDWDDKHDRIDQRRLLDGKCDANSNGCVPKTFARIIPRKNIHLTREVDLGAGHIVAKIRSLETNANIPYEKLALHTGTPVSYWWIGVHQVPGQPGIDTISVYVPSDWAPGGSKKAMWRQVGLMKTDPSNPGFKHAHASARFVWNDNDDETWVTCVAQGCCQPPAAIESSS